MDRTERFYKIHQMLEDRKLVPTRAFVETLGVSLATFKRDLAYMQNHLHAPIVYDHLAGGYRFEQASGIGPKYELPGLWFNDSEIHALLVAKHLLEEIQPGVLEPHIKPLISRLESLLDSTGHSKNEIEQRIFIVHPGRRSVDGTLFALCATGLLRRKQVRIQHRSRYTGETSERLLSPQRLVYYKNTWYLDTWCHTRNAVRSFSVDAMVQVVILDDPAKDVAKDELNAILDVGYGIFAGRNVQWAKLKFTPYQAKWVATERWHAEQRSSFEDDGSYLLEIPFSQDSELVMDILRYGADVEVLEPTELREKVAGRLKAAMARYRG
ncbi:MAG TPA: YafY family protein [Rhodocyclaceae bacterium]|nr:YafY family protein [Rhodocyclaceae bacterium]